MRHDVIGRNSVIFGSSVTGARTVLGKDEGRVGPRPYGVKTALGPYCDAGGPWDGDGPMDLDRIRGNDVKNGGPIPNPSTPWGR